MLKVLREARRDPKHDAFPYQAEAVEAIKNLTYAAIFHEQGLGKTKIAIDLALSWLQMDVVDSVLFVTKKGLVANWKGEIKEHSFLVPRVLGQSRKSNFYAFNSPARIYLTHYEVCKAELGRLKLFLKTRRLGIICDEAHKLKNPDSDIAETLTELAPLFARRVIMTGTPIANRPYDIWSLIHFLDSGQALGNDFADFKKRFDLTAETATKQDRRDEFERDIEELFGKIRLFTIRETKESAGIELPQKKVLAVHVEAEERQAEIYQVYRDELRAVVVRDGKAVVDNVDDVLKRLLRLVQIASSPRLVDESYRRDPGKLVALETLLDELLANADAKTIVWTSFTANADWLHARLKRFGAVKVHGKLSIDDRNDAIERFKKVSSVRILVATPGAAKEGLTLTMASTAIFFDRSFSLDDYLQAQDRIHRISQTKDCVIYNLIMRGTVDEWVDELLAAKHLAAKLGLGDISLADYKLQATYGFAETLTRILGSVVEVTHAD